MSVTRIYHNLDATHLGCLLAANASSPIRRFSEAIKAREYLCSVRCEASSTLPQAKDSLKPERVTMMASGEEPAICLAIAKALAIISSTDSVTTLTKPNWCASSALIRLPGQGQLASDL